MCLLQYQFSSMAKISCWTSHEGSWRMKLKGDSRSRSQQISFGLYFVMHDKSTFRIEICVSNFMSTNMQVQGTICVGMNLYWTTSRGLQYAFIITFLVRIYFFDNSTDNKKGGRWKIQHLAMETRICRANPKSNLHEARIWKNKVLIQQHENDNVLIERMRLEYKWELIWPWFDFHTRLCFNAVLSL